MCEAASDSPFPQKASKDATQEKKLLLDIQLNQLPLNPALKREDSLAKTWKNV